MAHHNIIMEITPVFRIEVALHQEVTTRRMVTTTMDINTNTGIKPITIRIRPMVTLNNNTTMVDITSKDTTRIGTTRGMATSNELDTPTISVIPTISNIHAVLLLRNVEGISHNRTANIKTMAMTSDRTTKWVPIGEGGITDSNKHGQVPR